MSVMAIKEQRVAKVNQIIRVIGDCGRHFFKSKNRYAYMEVDQRGRVWFVDDYTRHRIYTHYKGAWHNFSHGGTLRSLVIHFKDYIMFGCPLPVHVFGPYPAHLCNGDLWGYGDSMIEVRKAAAELGLIESMGVEPESKDIE